MTWHAQNVLWLLGLVPLLALVLLAGWRLRARARQRFLSADADAERKLPSSASGDAVVQPAMVVGHSAGLRAARGLLFLLGIALVVVALARPQFGSRTRVLHKRGIDVVIAMDFSKSMLARDVQPSRIERAVAEVQQFLFELNGDRVGVVAFAGETMQFPMTTDYAAASLFLRDLSPLDIPVGGTAIGRALTAAQRLLERTAQHRQPDAQSPSRVVILFTDGEDHEGDPVAAARALADAQVQLYVVGIGSRTGEPIPTYADDGTWTGYMRDEDGKPILTALTADNEKQLREIAEVTGGKYFRAERGTVGMQVIRDEMRQMKQTELQARKITVHEERYALVLLPAFLLILLEALLPDSLLGARRRRQTS